MIVSICVPMGRTRYFQLRRPLSYQTCYRWEIKLLKNKVEAFLTLNKTLEMHMDTIDLWYPASSIYGISCISCPIVCRTLSVLFSSCGNGDVFILNIVYLWLYLQF